MYVSHHACLVKVELPVAGSRYINVHSGTLFGQSCENRRCESTVNFKQLTGPGSISARTVPAPLVANPNFTNIPPLIRDWGS